MIQIKTHDQQVIECKNIPQAVKWVNDNGTSNLFGFGGDDPKIWMVAYYAGDMKFNKDISEYAQLFTTNKTLDEWLVEKGLYGRSH